MLWVIPCSLGRSGLSAEGTAMVEKQTQGCLPGSRLPLLLTSCDPLCLSFFLYKTDDNSTYPEGLLSS